MQTDPADALLGLKRDADECHHQTHKQTGDGGGEQTEPQVSAGHRHKKSRIGAHEHDALNAQIKHARSLREHLTDGGIEIRRGETNAGIDNAKENGEGKEFGHGEV